MSIPPAFLDELRARTTLSTLIMRTVPLKKAGREFKGCCPFHNERTPSFHVNDEKGFYHCFGCQQNGDAIRWLVDNQGYGFIDAVKELAAMAGLDVPAPDPRAAERERRRDDSTSIMDKAATYYANQLMQPNDASGAARAYLENRGIDAALWTRFGVGFAPNSKMGTRPHMADLGQPEELEQLGLVKRNADSGTLYDFFRRRIMIPIHDARGKVIAFGGRIVGPGEPKYLNSPDTPIFDKGRTLFNLHRASPQARATGRLVIVEGYLDVIGLARVGIEEAVAPNGTALTEAQMALAWKLVDEPIVCMDGDKAGRKAAVRAAVRALPQLSPGKGLSFVFPPEGQDPDDVARKGGAEAVSAMLATRMGLADVLWQNAVEQLGDRSPERVSRMRADLRNLITTIRDEDVRAAYAADFRIRFDQLQQRQNQLPGRTAPARQAVNNAVQEAIIKGLLLFPGAIAGMEEDVLRLQWLREDHARLCDALVECANGVIDLDEHLSRRGVFDIAAVVRTSEVLRMPFLVTQDRKAAEAELRAAIRSTVHPFR